jgi:metallo-beta-lactamase family protein
MIKVEFSSKNKTKSIVFSGDIGRWHDPILDPPAMVDSADYIVMDATYGGVSHESQEQASARLIKIINETFKAGGNIVIPSFVFERAQDLLYYIGQYRRDGQIPKIPVFLDSPMATAITSVFTNNPGVMNKNIRQMMAAGESPFEFPGLTLISSVEDSKSINSLNGPSIIIAGSGMATGGRIKHHLVNNISRPESTIVFVGYQAANTLGRLITDGNPDVRILGENYAVRARIEKIDGFSAHADNDELNRWLKGFKTAPKCLFIVHSEMANAEKFSQMVVHDFGWKVRVPQYGDKFIL